MFAILKPFAKDALQMMSVTEKPLWGVQNSDLTFKSLKILPILILTGWLPMPLGRQTGAIL
jgi:hypothetical protein